jgi:formylglycine-generating enzyme required for sulfatase activity
MNIRRVLLMIGIIALFFALCPAPGALANNLTVSNVSLYKSAGQPSGTIGIKFDLNWDNTFTGMDISGNAFFDRAWVFIKYFDSANNGTDTAWSHATLTTGGTIGDYNSASGTGISTDMKGAFCKPGVNQVVYWNYAADGISSSASISVKVMAIEMVYIPQGAFYAGSGGAESGAFYSYPKPADPYKVASDAAITVGTVAGNLYYAAATYSGDLDGPIPAEFPKGYKGFYVMKYELTQGQYRDFLNTLDRAQQISHVASIEPDYYALPGTAIAANIGNAANSRNGIRLPETVPGTGPITFGCDYNNNKTYNEAADGEFIACNYLSWADLCAFADWAGLRPMTELEFEKASRGPVNPAADGYAWGTGGIAVSAYTLNNADAANEGISLNYSTTLGNCAYSTTTTGIHGPLRCGIFAANSGNIGRVTSGASYYGIMELSGNLCEHTVSVGNTGGRAFAGSHGDGDLSTANSDWPSASSADGSGFRGGDWNGAGSTARVSDRDNAALAGASRANIYGIRCARTFE